MSERYIHKVITLNADDEDVATGRKRLPSTIVGRAARRMTHLGTLVARVVDPQSLDPNTSLIYGSTYAEDPHARRLCRQFSEPESHAFPELNPSQCHPAGLCRNQNTGGRVSPLCAVIETWSYRCSMRIPCPDRPSPACRRGGTRGLDGRARPSKCGELVPGAWS